MVAVPSVPAMAVVPAVARVITMPVVIHGGPVIRVIRVIRVLIVRSVAVSVVIVMVGGGHRHGLPLTRLVLTTATIPPGGIFPELGI